MYTEVVEDARAEKRKMTIFFPEINGELLVNINISFNSDGFVYKIVLKFCHI
ncbi:unnamed protein product [Larinioides sclopetarius]|uniref:Uncharacterized protein n=1 Tax=Larinioides sclopetarius TaxID=280406 RepID=A0AAV2AIU9_9ARAC